MKPTLIDNRGRRLGADRRQFSYLMHIPEHRSGLEHKIKALEKRFYWILSWKGLIGH
jgi:hypothetical protein